MWVPAVAQPLRYKKGRETAEGPFAPPSLSTIDTAMPSPGASLLGSRPERVASHAYTPSTDNNLTRVDDSSCLSAGKPPGPRGRKCHEQEVFNEDMLLFASA